MESPNNNKESKHRFRNVALILIGGAFSLFGFWYLLTDGFADPTQDIVDAGSGDAKVVEVSDLRAGETEVTLSGDNTDIKWTGSNSIGQTPTGFFYKLAGSAVVNPETKELTKFEVLIDMNGVKAMASALTKKLKHKGFFEVDKFPTAKFVSTSISQEVLPSYPAGTTCVVEGNFQLRDVTKSIKIPMECSVDGGSVKLKSAFKISRKEYGVIYSDSTGDRLIRDSVLIEIEVDSLRASEPANLVNSATPAAKTNSNQERAQPLENFTETIAATLVEFDMVLVPGDQENEVEPFCIGKNEVTWDEFDYWALCKNMSDKNSINEISQQLRPSAPHDISKVYRGWGRENQPVVGISKLSAQLYCKWLSEQTGKKYRLPTAQEWDLAFRLGGGKLEETKSAEELLKQAWFIDNALSTDDEGFDFERAMPVGKLSPNKLGIHDMLGNASEWVETEDDKNIVRGGHFKLSADELTGSHAEVEDQNIWNKDYPQDPKSKWWYVNADYVGFRVVCESE